MQLAPLAEGYYEHTSLDLLFKQINEHAKNEGYAITRKRSKPSKLRILMKAVLRCDHGGRWLNWGGGVNEKVGVLWEYCARCRNLVFWGNIAPSAGRKKSGLRLGFKGGVAAK